MRVHCLRFGTEAACVLYASLACSHRVRAKQALTSFLRDSLEMLAGPGTTVCRGDARPARAELGVHASGRPVLASGGALTPSISFSHSRGVVWGAVCSAPYEVGLDVAAPEEFAGGYPVERILGSEEELLSALEATSWVLEDAAALIWSAKEATVKALGWGLHRLDPRRMELRVPQTDGGRGDQRREIRFERGVIARFPHLADRPVAVRALRDPSGWVSFAVVPRSTDQERLHRGRDARLA